MQTVAVGFKVTNKEHRTGLVDTLPLLSAPRFSVPKNRMGQNTDIPKANMKQTRFSESQN